MHVPKWGEPVQYQFYNKVGKSTSIFWPMTRDDVNRLGELQLISVKDCKDAAKKVDSLDLDKPNEHPRPKN